MKTFLPPPGLETGFYVIPIDMGVGSFCRKGRTVRSDSEKLLPGYPPGGSPMGVVCSESRPMIDARLEEDSFTSLSCPSGYKIDQAQEERKKRVFLAGVECTWVLAGIRHLAGQLG